MAGSIELSVIVPLIYDEGPTTVHFDNLVNQSLEPWRYELILVHAMHGEGSHVDESRFGEARDGRPRVRLLRPGPMSRARANNLGAREAEADILLFLADDFVTGPGHFEAHLEFHRRNPGEARVGIGGSRFREELRRDHFRRWAEDSGHQFGLPLHHEGLDMPPTYFYAANSSLKKSFFEKVGRYDEDFVFPAWDDYELGQRMLRHGMSSSWIPGAMAYHEHLITLENRQLLLVQAGESAVIFERKNDGPRPWKRQARTPPWIHRLRSKISLWRFRLSGNPVHLETSWRHMLQASFSEGYLRSAPARRIELSYVSPSP